MRNDPRTRALPVLGTLLLTSLSAPSAGVFELIEVSNGFGPLLPHRIAELDANGVPTGSVLDVRSLTDLVDNLTPTNPVLPVEPWDLNAVVPGGAPGNHFVAARFDEFLAIESILDPSPAGQAVSGLAGSITVVAVDPLTGDATPVQGRAFVGGATFAGTAIGNPPELPLQIWVRQVGGEVVPNATVDNDGDGAADGLGFPGTEATFPGSGTLSRRDTFVFVADTDGDLRTHETFPTGRQIQIRIRTSVQSAFGQSLVDAGHASGTVGPDFLEPEIGFSPPPGAVPAITPGNGDLDVDPLTTLGFRFTEPVQPLSVGPLDQAMPPAIGALIQVRFGPSAASTSVPYTVRPTSPYDLSTYELIPAYPFPGSGPAQLPCTTYAQVDVVLNPSPSPQDPLLQDLSDAAGLPNGNLLGAATFFVTGEGATVANAPVTPDAIYVASAGNVPGLSVIDLNGFGQSTGDPTFGSVPGMILEGETNFPHNPNLLQIGIEPPLQPGTCTFDGGSAGVFTRTLDSRLDPLLVRSPAVASVADMMLGHALDTTFNAGPPFGCQSGGNVCATTGLKAVDPSFQGGALVPNLPPPGVGALVGAENVVSWAPHPNPPRILYPPLCTDPFLITQEPTSIDTALVPLPNLLAPGDPFGNPNGNPPTPPSGLLTPEQNAFFVGPTFGQDMIASCTSYQIRQQVGQFLYVLDRTSSEVVVLNSNRMTVIDRVSVPGPTSSAIGPNLDFLAVTSRDEDTVTFIDVAPSSATFHQVVKVTGVGDAPCGIAWQGENEDLLVCNEGDDSISVISAFTLDVRKTLTGQLSQPFEVAILPRQTGFGFARNVYFAFILNRTGSVSVFESGPDGVNGWGYDDIIGVSPFRVRNPRAIQPDPLDLTGAAWIAHEGPIDRVTGKPGPFGEGAITKIAIDSATIGQLPLQAPNPQFRSMTIAVATSIGEEELSGIPEDLAFDDQRNLGALPNPSTLFGAGSPVPINGKSLVRRLPGGGPFTNTNEPQFLFLAVSNPQSGSGVVDVLSLGGSAPTRFDTNAFQAGVQSVPAPGVSTLMSYFRQ